MLTKWLLPPDGGEGGGGGYPFGSAAPVANVHGGRGNSLDPVVVRQTLYSLPARSGMVGVCYDEAADTVSAISKHGSVVVAQGIPGLRL